MMGLQELEWDWFDLGQREVAYSLLALLAAIGTLSVIVVTWKLFSPVRATSKALYALTAVATAGVFSGLLWFVYPTVTEIINDLREPAPLESPEATAGAPKIALYDIDGDGAADVMSFVEGDNRQLAAVPTKPDPDYRLPITVGVLGVIGAVLTGILAIVKGGLDPRDIPQLIADLQATIRAHGADEANKSGEIPASPKD